jgi:hypothetical protein
MAKNNVSIITELPNSERHSKWRSLGYTLNIDEKKRMPHKTYHQINWYLCLSDRYNVTIFELGKYYASTKQLIQGALDRHPVIIVDGSSVHRISTKEELTTVFSNAKGTKQRKVNLLNDIFQDAVDEFFLKQEQAARAQKLQAVKHVTPDTDFLHKYAPIYQVDVDYQDEIDIRQKTSQLKFYLDNDILPDEETLIRRLKSYTQDELPTDIKELFDLYNFYYTTESPDTEPLVVSIGNSQYLEDTIYQGEY